MRRSTILWALQQLKKAPAASATKLGGGLLFADRAVKMTHANALGCSFICTPAVLACRCPHASTAVRLATDETGVAPVAQVQLRGMCAVSLFRSQRLAFHCAGEAGILQTHEIGLRCGDVLALLGGCDLLRDWRSVDRILRSVAHEDLEYITEELLLELGTNARVEGDTNSNNSDTDDDSGGNSTCVMTVVRNKPSGMLPQPPASLQCSAM
ncbi:hypothetical protein DQ04_02381060 [Trypanosoma grayi]|uniref:hypothetical protein n=1 Tax=Trypanosoma grayi TaxID=71804 RepID=UPI0004F435D3|nr:hypothetical protein DQ04_02381060 [Trypanosoma grayi]KEG11671.1 hypothetical protein DQ04_02381060 [Trypanosoma grayi]